MFMNDLNSEAPIQQNTAAPLYHDTSGRFSRKGKPVVVNEKTQAFFDNVLIVLFVTFLLSSDFILFSGSGNVEVFRNSIFPIPEVSFIILLFLVFSSLIVYFLRNFKIAKNIFASLISFGLVFVLYRQFSTIQQIMAIGDTRIPVYVALGLGFAIICYGILNYGNFFVRLLLLVAAGTLFVHVYIAYIGHHNQPEFLESYNSQKKGEGAEEKFVYFFLPNLSSYSYMAMDKSPTAFKTRKIINGFYQKNKFVVYPKAFAPEESFLQNMVRALNPESKKTGKTHILKTRLLSEYWRFYNIRHEYINLKDNSLYDYFKQKGYMISAYKSRDFDMCHKNHEINVDRCIEKVNQPVNIYDIKLSKMSKVNILLMEWIASMRIINNMTSIFSFMSKFVNLQQTPMVGIDYSNLYVVNATKTFNILLQNILEDKGKQAYFVFVDLPSNMYIYDEYCQIKPTDKWYDISNLPWIKNDLTEKRSKAYMQQTRCLYGELEYFMQQLQKHNLLKNTTIVLQGTSSVNGFSSERDDDFSTDFMANRLVNLAIYEGKNPKHKLDWRFCDTSQLVDSYLSGKNKCPKLQKMKVHDTIVKNMDNKIGYLAADMKMNAQKEFEEWYKHWESANQEKISVNIKKLSDLVLLKEKSENMQNDSFSDEYFGL